MPTHSPETETDGPAARSGTERTGTDARPDRAKRVAAAAVGGTLLVRGLRRRSASGVASALAGAWLLSRALGDDRLGRFVGRALPTGREPADRSGTPGETAVSRSITVGRPADELHEAWRDPDLFAQAVGHVAEVEPAGDGRLRWTVRGPRGRDLAWETRVVDEEPGEFLRWETPPDAVLPNEGSVRFRPAPGDRGTEMTLSVDFDPPGGAVGDAAFARLDALPSALVGTALRRFKSLVESGEAPTLAGNPSARGRGDRI